MTGIWSRLAEIVEKAGYAALVSVVDVRGSAPREAGARMIVTPDGGYSGTIGGGALEYEAIKLAQGRLQRGEKGAHLRRMSLGPELAQCCGGSVRLLFETYDADDAALPSLAQQEKASPFTTDAEIVEGQPVLRRPSTGSGLRPAVVLGPDGRLAESFADTRQPVLLFGAGHVGRALVLALAPLPFRLRWVDSRPEAFPAAVPGNVTTRLARDPAALIAEAEPDSFVLIMTHSHPVDLDICRAALTNEVLAYVGLIGSATKRARFASQLRAAGLPAATLERLHCPIGLPDLHEKTPAAIAASVTADLLLRRQTLLRSVSVENKGGFGVHRKRRREDKPMQKSGIW